MRNKIQPRISRVDAKKVTNFFAELSKQITSGRDKVRASKKRSGEMNFIVGKEQIRISVTAIRKGGVL